MKLAVYYNTTVKYGLKMELMQALHSTLKIVVSELDILEV